MAQPRFIKPLSVFLAICLLASCKPSPQPFDQVQSGAQGVRPPAHQDAMPYDKPAPTPRDEAMYDPTLVPPSQIVKVGLLLPLSGEAAGLGTAMRDAAVMALFDKYATLKGEQAGIRVELVTKDTRGTPEGAREAATAAVKEGATLLLGPLFARSVEAVKPLAQTGKITIISFSNDKSVAGDGVFVFGFDPAEQAARVANYAFRKDIFAAAALAPNDAYGRQVLGSFTHVSKMLGRKVQPVVRYSTAGATLSQDIRALVSEGTEGARFKFSALFLPEGGQRLGGILSTLATMNVTPRTIQFIGTGLWDDKDLIRNYNLDGAWLASAPPANYDGFEQRYRSSYGGKPPRLASLAYDAVALASTLATTSQGMARGILTSPSGFSGPANGIFRFRKDGSTERGLAVLEVDGHNGFKVVDPAPASFK